MNILILGSGGREHSLAWAIKQNPKCDRLIVAPGNAGIAMLAECADIDIMDGGAVAVFAEENAIDFVVVGPEAPLAAGVADRLRDAGLLVFGQVRRPPSLRPQNPLPRRFATPPTPPPPPMPISLMRTPPARISATKAPPLWSRPTGWPLAKASLSP